MCLLSVADDHLGGLSRQLVQPPVDFHGGDARSRRYSQPSNSTLIRKRISRLTEINTDCLY